MECLEKEIFTIVEIVEMDKVKYTIHLMYVVSLTSHRQVNAHTVNSKVLLWSKS